MAGPPKRESFPSKPSRRRSASAYWRLSQRPLASLALLAPLMVIYEAGTLALGPDAIRNGADAVLRQILTLFGATNYFVLPVALVAWLVAWHHVRRDPWEVKPAVLGLMYLEAALWAGALLGVGNLFSAVWPLSLRLPATAALLATAGPQEELAPKLVAYCGAGLYEELLFRAILLTALTHVLRPLIKREGVAVIVAAAASSFLFAAAHHQPFSAWGDPFDAGVFTYRMVAGVFFAAVYLKRGLGVTAAAHAGYDLLLAAL